MDTNFKGLFLFTSPCPVLTHGPGPGPVLGPGPSPGPGPKLVPVLSLGPSPVIFLVPALVPVPSYFWSRSLSRSQSRSQFLVWSHSGVHSRMVATSADD